MDPSNGPEPAPNSGEGHATDSLSGLERLVRDHARSAGPGVGDWIGPYRLLGLLGEGGFGEVWLAERREPFVQRVALKLIKPGMDSRAVVARFEQERQALAVMDHPNVARVIDGGVTSAAMGSRPYFVMEHVQGESITRFCDRHTCTVRQRLTLMVQVCEAVQHAHHKGIIHRDLKPSNILVMLKDEQPIPKVIDFGVSKAISGVLTDKTIFTELGRMIGTPEYMSPEQAEMGAVDIDTRADVYSLGVVVYELISGLLPFDSGLVRSGGVEEARRIIREHEAPKPSVRLAATDAQRAGAIAACRRESVENLLRLLRRELDWIPLKALRKDRVERYRSPNDLADDLRRYLAGRALEAGPETAGYQVRKFVKRHRRGLGAAGAVLSALLIGLAGTVWQAREARREARAARLAEAGQRRLAEEQAEARRMADAKSAEAETARQAAEYEAYAANIVAADACMLAGEPASAATRLAACPPHLRGWEWGWLQAQTDESALVLRGQTGLVSCITFSPDGQAVVSGAVDGQVRVWDALTGLERMQRQVDGGAIVSAALTRDGQRLAAVGQDGALRTWNVQSGAAETVVHTTPGALALACFNADATRLVTWATQGLMRVVDVPSGRTISEADVPGPCVFAMFSPDGGEIMTGSLAADGGVQSWSADEGRAKERWALDGARPLTVGWTRDGPVLVSTTRRHEVIVRQTGLGETYLRLEGHQNLVSDAAFSPDGSRLVTTSWDQTARVWNLADGRELAVLRGHVTAVGRSAFSPDGQRIVTMPTAATGVRIWNLADFAPPRPSRGCRDVAGGRFSSEGRIIVGADAGGAESVMDASTGTRLGRLAAAEASSAGPIRAVACSHDGRRLAVARGSAGVVVATLEPGAARETTIAEPRGVTALCFWRDGARLLVGCDDGAVGIFDASTGRLIGGLGGHAGPVTTVMLDVAGTRVLTASLDGAARIWRIGDAAPEQILGTPGPADGRVIAIAVFSPEGNRVVTAMGDPFVRVWDAQTGIEQKVLRGHRSEVVGAAFSPDGRRIVTASNDTTARVYDAASGEELLVLRGHGGALGSAVFSPDGARIVTASSDRTARVWDAVRGRELVALRGHVAPVAEACFSRNGAQVLTRSSDGACRAWTSVPNSYRQRERLRAEDRIRWAELRRQVQQGRLREWEVAPLPWVLDADP